MKQATYICILVVFAGVVLVSTIAAPTILSDGNKFLLEFVGPEFLGILGVILAITLASSGQLHLAFNQIEERFKTHGLTRTRASVRSDTYALIALFLVAVVVVIAKSALADSAWSQSLFNGTALLILLWNTLLLLSLTRTVFKIPAVFDQDEDAPTPKPKGKRD
jgi:hypothetical protein